MSERLRRNQTERRERNRAARFLRAYWVEILIVIGLALAIFLLFERLNIRGALFGLLQAAAQASTAVAQRLSASLRQSIAGLGLSELIAIPLLIGVLLLIGWRVRWRLQRTPALADLHCPQCGGAINRVHRRYRDHVISIVVPVRRYRCPASECRWSGLRVSTGIHSLTKRSRPERPTLAP